MEIKPRLIIGLGNPSPQYSSTYHNAGFLFIDYIAEILNSKFEIRNKFQAPKSKLFIFFKSDERIFVKPLTFMNESGKAVKEAMKYFKIKPEETLIVHDDSDIELGKYKISFGRGSAGHRGIQSIIDSLKTKNFRRLRIGIRQATSDKRRATRKKASELVLKKISKNDLKVFKKLFSEIDI